MMLILMIRTHSFPRKIFAKFHKPFRKILQFTAAKSSKFRGLSQPYICEKTNLYPVKKF